MNKLLIWLEKMKLREKLVKMLKINKLLVFSWFIFPNPFYTLDFHIPIQWDPWLVLWVLCWIWYFSACIILRWRTLPPLLLLDSPRSIPIRPVSSPIFLDSTSRRRGSLQFRRSFSGRSVLMAGRSQYGRKEFRWFQSCKKVTITPKTPERCWINEYSTLV